MAGPSASGGTGMRPVGGVSGPFRAALKARRNFERPIRAANSSGENLLYIFKAALRAARELLRRPSADATPSGHDEASAIPHGGGSRSVPRFVQGQAGSPAGRQRTFARSDYYECAWMTSDSDFPCH
ncbi:hypothetical protein GCM10010172_17590 [Paractinoplanes ferrugineus]|uniref:Uncharacterized protein n=1 Tax=Paractinoplanes ferrugineus TaxID=113564 RepID=A0A919J509_9ACTN|nr:hypothetical protein Afe05nite_67910 [Actinoplanes ferrugineus]